MTTSIRSLSSTLSAGRSLADGRSAGPTLGGCDPGTGVSSYGSCCLLTRSARRCVGSHENPTDSEFVSRVGFLLRVGGVAFSQVETQIGRTRSVRKSSWTEQIGLITRRSEVQILPPPLSRVRRSGRSGGRPFCCAASCDRGWVTNLSRVPLSERNQPDAWRALRAAQVRLAEVNARARTTRRPQTRNHGSQR